METKNKVDDLKKVLEGKRKKQEQQEETAEENLSTVEKELMEAQEEAKATQEKLLHALADFENYKKRIHKEQQDFSKYSVERFLKELLPILDDFDRFFEHLSKGPNEEMKTVVDGTRLIYGSFQKCLKRFHVEEIATDGEKFDPHWHEAIGEEESPLEKGAITQCHRKGYKLHDRLLRPAMVTIAK